VKRITHLNNDRESRLTKQNYGRGRKGKRQSNLNLGMRITRIFMVGMTEKGKLKSKQPYIKKGKPDPYNHRRLRSYSRVN